MAKVSRPKTRRYLFQALYARAMSGSDAPREDFLGHFFDEGYGDCLDTVYLDEAYAGIIERESTLLSILARFAPRFELQSVARANLVIACVALYEMYYLRCDAIPENVSINEAIELAKTYSDPASRTFLNGVLNSAKNDKAAILADPGILGDRSYSFLFHASAENSIVEP